MALALVGLYDALRAANVPVVEYPGWSTRGQTDGPFSPRAVMWHHDASAPGDSPSVPAMMANLENNGAQCWVDRQGVWHLVAAGRMWHAGTGGGWGRIPADSGNTYSVGIETDHTTGEDWPDVQVQNLRRGTAVLLDLLDADAFNALCGHKEYRVTNPDPDGLNMPAERVAVSQIDPNPGSGGGQPEPIVPKRRREKMQFTMEVTSQPITAGDPRLAGSPLTGGVPVGFSALFLPDAVGGPKVIGLSNASGTRTASKDSFTWHAGVTGAEFLDAVKQLDS